MVLLLKPRSYRAGGFDLGGDFCIKFPKHESIKCYTVVSGECWLSVEGVPDAVRLSAGDCFVLPHALSSCLSSDLTLTPVEAETVFPFPLNGRIASYNGGGDCLLVGGNFIVVGKPADILFAELPPVVYIRKESDKAAMRWSPERLREELRDPQPGGLLGAQQLAAITSIHDQPAHDWTVEELGQRAGMSRFTFALRFKETVGVAPREYLTRWRMLLAADRMANTRDSISEIAHSVAYESASAFTKAFKKIMGRSPRQYSRGQNSTSSDIASAEPPEANRFQP